jgi:hypothetical protein
MKGCSCLLALAAVAALGAAAPEPGFTSLFNGKDLTGWRYPGPKGAPMDGQTATPDRRVEVKDGVIVMNAKDAGGKGGIKDLYTQPSFDRDFVLRLQFRASLKSDSGVYLRGPQLQVRDFLRRGEQQQLQQFKNDDWNDLEVVVKGTEATFTVNGEKLLKPESMRIPARGPVGLQAETGKFEFRNVRIKTVD